MNNTNTISTIFYNIADRIRILSGAVLMAVGLLFFVFWFGWNMNTYVRSIETHGAGFSVTNVSGGTNENISSRAVADVNR